MTDTTAKHVAHLIEVAMEEALNMSGCDNIWVNRLDSELMVSGPDGKFKVNIPWVE